MPSSEHLALSVLIPCYNEVDNLVEMYRRVSAAGSSVVGGDYEIVLVNDGSKDGTWEKIKEISHGDSHVVGIDLSRNFGHQVALTAGMQMCRGDRILIIDADLQDPPELLPQMFGLMNEGADVVFGKRSSRRGEHWLKKVTARLFYRIFRRLSDVDFPLDTGDFRLISRRVLENLLDMPEQHRFVRGMISWLGFNQVPIEYERQERHAGRTGYSPRKMIRLALDAITGFSTTPLRFASYLGLVLALLSVIYFMIVIYTWLVERTVEGWTSLMAAVLILGSVQLLVLGVMGEYLGRLFMGAKQRPLFVVREVVAQERAAEDQRS